MCIKIISTDSESKYNASIPLEKQINNCSEVLIQYDPKDKDLGKFLSEMERLCSSGISANIKLDVVHNNSVVGMKAKKQLQRITKDLDINEAIKLLTKIHSTTDKTLKELSIFCQK